MLGLFPNECENDEILLSIIFVNLKFGCIAYCVLKFRKIFLGAFLFLVYILFFCIAVTLVTFTLCTVIFQIGCLSITKNIPPWLSLFLTVLSNDIHVNPGPHFHNSVFNFINWNLNSLVKDNLQRVQLIEAGNSIFNYELISICETSLNDSVGLPVTLLDEYTFVPANNPANTRYGGVGLFYKNLYF